MNLDPYIAVSGQGDLFKLVTTRNNGLVLENIQSGKSKFYPLRKHQFTPLGTVAIYTLDGTTALQEVFTTMMTNQAKTPPVDPKGENHIIEEYFDFILPDYDEDKVSIKDMRKAIKWFNFLNSRGLLSTDEEE